ncbi:MAG: peptidylprolyl isomerase [Bacteroidales bacterium]|nr:peptidylprolyl isomerase [Bacteroidales bacterium]MBQ2351978.1 peptidylprolyl isomerase [Bacteroidales bacterium]MBQ2541866.1 peptidylprolyl isomerase [Bacteroidales bacterium]MBQ5571239.1 peptidylprolyl isomerase [Bacteroidales bacterium]
MKKTIIMTAIALLVGASSQAQGIIDKIVGIVGNEIIMMSDIENQYIQMASQQMKVDGNTRCEILEDMMFQKLLYVQAQKDSLSVTPKEVETELDRRLSVFINQIGSEQKLEEYFGKTIKSIKDDLRSTIEEQMLAQKVQQKIIGDTKVTPSEVKNFFEKLPADSIPTIEAYYELSEIVIKPEVSKEDKEKVVAELNKIRERILNGESFSTMAVLYSEDPGSAMKGGELGFVSKTDLVPEFSQVAFNLTSPLDVSQVVETEYGFHIIQMIEKKGNMMNFRHILMKPKVSMEALEAADKKANEVYSILQSDTISFIDAVKKYSNGDSKGSDGKVMNPYYGDARMTSDFLDPYTKSAVMPLKEGEYSKPFLSSDNKGSRVIKIVRLDLDVKEHKANMKDDYLTLQRAALEDKNSRLIDEWVKDKVQSVYIKIDDEYKDCNFNVNCWIKK